MKSINTPPTPRGMGNILRALKERGESGSKSKALKKRTNSFDRAAQREKEAHKAIGDKHGSAIPRHS